MMSIFRTLWVLGVRLVIFGQTPPDLELTIFDETNNGEKRASVDPTNTNKGPFDWLVLLNSSQRNTNRFWFVVKGLVI